MNIKKIISIILLSTICITSISINSKATDIEVDNNVVENLDNNTDNTTETDENNNNNNSNNYDYDNNDDTTNNESNSNTSNDDNNTNNNEYNNSNNAQDNNNDSENNYNAQNNNTNQDDYEYTYNVNSNLDNDEDDESDDANLKSLYIDVNIDSLYPKFNEDITDYYLIVDLETEEINVEAIPKDDNASVTVRGNTDLKEGENTIEIVVTAEAGNTKTYNIHVTKTDNLESANANLKSLSIRGFSIYPLFKYNIYNYNLTINEIRSRLEVLVETESEEATYKIIGNENLTEGDNLIKVVVTAKDGVTQREYKINVYISSNEVQEQKMNITPAIVMISVLSALVVIVVIGIIKKNN